ncbi:MAG: serine/threonine dehydratase [Muricauda sp.]|nr:serine/threonine dehydratase [Allomuricauda sp.]MAU26877.1 serine/threonine dehydratase [Allomuricauda sp.]MBC31175.1 serine/threonine dehydratase [Allomuricauda sp.]|tara:strand:+ start:11237 stop:12223 length:987 start_codon:yes stop_codon:yes gene_type:complete
MALNLEDIQAAKRRIDPYIKQTPILYSSLLNKWLGHDIYFKCENFQKIGAFKVRGGVNTVSWLIENNNRPKHIVANSSGNHAQAVAYAAKQFNIPATIYMPNYSSKVKVQATKGYGAEVLLSETRDITDVKVQEAATKEGTYWIPPYNHEQVICGQGTAVYEALTELGEVNAVFAPCGGGGLLSGSLIASRGLSPKTRVIGVEPLNANDAAESLRKGSIQRLSSVPDTLADGAMTMAVGDITFEYLKKLDGFYEIEEMFLAYWTQWLTHLLKCRIEPTCAMTMEAVRRWLKTRQSKQKVLVVISGGNVDQATTQRIWAEDFLQLLPGL